MHKHYKKELNSCRKTAIKKRRRRTWFSVPKFPVFFRAEVKCLSFSSVQFRECGGNRMQRQLSWKISQMKYFCQALFSCEFASSLVYTSHQSMVFTLPHVLRIFFFFNNRLPHEPAEQEQKQSNMFNRSCISYEVNRQKSSFNILKGPFLQ